MNRFVTPSGFEHRALAVAVRARGALALGVALVLGVTWGITAGLFALAVGLCVTALGAAQMSAPAQRWLALRLLLVLAEFALVTLVLLYGNPFDAFPPHPKALLFRSPAVLLLFALVTINALTVRPSAAWWAGLCAIGCWSAAAWATLLDPLTLTKAQVHDEDYDTLIAYLGAIFQPRYFAIDLIWFQLAILGGCSVILGTMAWRTRALARATAERQAALASLSAHFAAPVAEALLSGGLEQRPAAMPLAILDCDLVGFSRIAARMTPETVAAALRVYHGFVEARVFANGGAVLNYAGDGVIAVFGFHGEPDAARAAIACGEALVAEWNAAGHAAFAPGDPPSIALGIDHGSATAGILGEGRALSLVVVGPPVEGAARLQAERGGRAELRVSDAARAASA